MLVALLALASLTRLPPYVPTDANWKTKDQAVLDRAAGFHEGGDSEAALALIARYFAGRPGSELLGAAYLQEARTRVDVLKRPAMPETDRIRLAEAAYVRARDAGVPEPDMRAERLALARWLAGRGFYGEAYEVQNELRKDLQSGLFQQLQYLEGAVLAARSDRADLGERQALFLLDAFDTVVGDMPIRAYGASARARVESALVDRALAAAESDDARAAAIARLERALERLGEALVEFPRGDHRAEHFLERARLYKKMGLLRPTDAEFFLSQAAQDLDRALELSAPGVVREQTLYQIGDVMRMQGRPGTSEALDVVIEVGGEAVPLAHLAEARAVLDQTGVVSLGEYFKGLGGLESRGLIEEYDVDIGEAIRELEEAGRRAATASETHDVILLFGELRRLYPERRGLAETTAELYLQAARKLAERRLEALAENDEARATRDRSLSAEYYKQAAVLQQELAEGLLPDEEARGLKLRVAANILYEGRLFDRAAAAYAAAKRDPFDLLMEAFALKQAGVLRDAHDRFAFFTAAYDDGHIFKPTALIQEGDVLSSLGRYADAVDRYRRVQEIRGPGELDRFQRIKVMGTEEIRLDLWDSHPATADPTYWGESLLGIARAAYGWSRQLKASGDPEKRRRTLLEGVEALGQYRARYLADYEAGTAPPPPGALSVYYHLALLAIEEGRWADADAPIEQVITLGRSREYVADEAERRMWRTAHTLYGDAALSRQLYGSADRRYDDAVRRFSTSPESMFARIGRLKALVAQAKLDEARVYFQETVREYERLGERIAAELDGVPADTPTPRGLSKARWDLELSRFRKELALE